MSNQANVNEHQLDEFCYVWFDYIGQTNIN